MDEFFVYILYSEKNNKSYVGFTADLFKRMKQHNFSVENKRAFTYRFRPWLLIHFETFSSKSQALMREKWFKSGIGREHRDRIISEFFQKLSQV